MAHGDKNYFRHSFRARNDEFIVFLLDKMGAKGYFMWFILVEMCSERLSDGEEQPFIFNKSTLYKELKCTQSKLDQFLTYSASMMKVEYAYVSSGVDEDDTKVLPMLSLSIKNLSKFNGHYQKKSPNKSKVKETKVKERKVNTNTSKVRCEISEMPEFYRTTPKEIQLWVTSVTFTQLDKWFNIYQAPFLLEELTLAYEWDQEQTKKKKALGGFLTNWFRRSTNPHKPRYDDTALKALFDKKYKEMDENPATI